MMVTDPSVPGMMTTILRTYSKKLAATGSALRSSKMRAEAALEGGSCAEVQVAEALVDYLSIVCGKNLTKVP